MGDYDGMSPMEAFGMELEGLQLDNIDVVEGLQLEFQVQFLEAAQESRGYQRHLSMN